MNDLRPLLMLSALALTACHTNHYSTPRTVPKGQSSHIVAVHAEAIPGIVYIGRVGVADRVDLGFHASVYFNRVDVKYNFLRSKVLDMAIDPSVSLGYEPVVDDYQWKGTLPLMMGLNVHPRVTLMVQGGPVLMRYTEPTYYWESAPATNDALILTGTVGGGVQLRITELIYLQPEVSFNYFIYDPVNGSRYWPNIGIGLGFGPQPRYDDTDKSKD